MSAPTTAPVRSFAELRARARVGPPAAVAVVAADSPSALAAVGAAVREGIAAPILVGDDVRIREIIDNAGIAGLEHARFVPAASPDAAAAVAVALAREGEAEILLKGALRSDQLLRAALDRDAGLRTSRLLSDVLIYEDALSGSTRLVGVTDGGINPAPDAAALRQIVLNAVAVFHALGHERPRVALLSASEVVIDSLPSTALARDVAEWAAREIDDADVAGPLALDNALLASAAEAKGIAGPVAGHADIMVTPAIEAGNILGKGVKYLAGSITAHVVVGAAVPILIPSRVESAADKLHSVALGSVVRRSRDP